MERRELLAAFVVTNNGDSGSGTFRQAILDANASSGANLITFNLPSNQLTIQPLTPLPEISNTLQVYDATSQPGWAGVPLVVLSGANVVPTNSPALVVSGGSDTIKGLVINSWAGAAGTAITLTSLGRDVVQNCYIGTDATGTVAVGNGGDGIDIGNGNNTIGGAGANQGNVISANSGDGILISGSGTSANVIQGNIIGLGADGTTAIGNSGTGIITNAAISTQIGGSAGGAGNVISANSVGVVLQGTGPNSNTLQGNFIGTDATGTLARKNTFNGLTINGSGGNIIGGAAVGAGNVISGNGAVGVFLQGATAQNNLIKGNFIGTALGGTSPLGNANEGILVNGALNDVIGGLTTADGNVIAFNGGGAANAGINVLAGTSIEILTNSIFQNVGGGILLSNGANGNQAAPVITEAETGAGQTNISGTLTSLPDTQFTVQFFSNPAADPSGFGQGQTYLGSTVVTTDGSGQGTFNIRLTVGVTVGQFITATATQQAVQNTSKFSADAAITAAPVANLTVSIAASPAGTVLLGALETYTITVTNTGPDDATGVQLTSTVDDNSTISTDTPPTSSQGDPPTVNGQVVLATLGSIAANASATVTITVVATATGTISITSIVSADEIVSDPSGETATVTVDVAPAADLQVLLNADPSPVGVGGILTYVVTVVNNGPSIANDVVIVDQLPADVTFIDVNPADGTADAPDALNRITWSIPSVPIGGSATLTIRVRPTVVESITNTVVSATADEADPDSTNNTPSLTTPVQNASDLSVSVAPSPTPAVANQPLTYVVTLTNAGPSPATGAFLTDILPAGVIFVSGSYGAGLPVTYDGATNTVTAPVGAIAADGTATVTIVVTPTKSEFLTNTAIVSNANEIDNNPDNNRATTPVVPVSPANLAITLTGTPEPVTPGGTITYLVTVTNNGPADATGVIVQDVIPAGVFVNSIIASQGTANQADATTITAILGTIASGGSATISVVVTPQAVGAFVSTVTVSGDQIDQDTANNTATVTNTVNPADVGVAVSTSTTSPIVGDPFSYTFFIANAGPTTANSVVFTDTLPAGLTLVSVSVGSATVTNGTVSVSLGSLTPGASAQVVLVVVPTAVGTVVNTGTVTTTSFDADPANDTATASLDVTNAPGVFDLDATDYTIAEDAGSLSITVNRIHGTQGTVVVNYTTIDGTAISGVNYVGTTTGQLTFADGQQSATIVIPLIQDGQISPTLTFQVALTGASDGGVLGARTTATVNELNVDLDTIPPVVTAIVPIFTGRSIGSLVLTFNKALDPATANDPQNYKLAVSARDYRPGVGGRAIAIASVSYVNGVVTIVPASPLGLNVFYSLTIDGSTSRPITDIYGLALSGTSDLTPGGTFLGYVAMGTSLTYLDAGANSVNLKLSRGGIMALTRSSTGEANLLQLLATVPGKTRISGTVRKTSKASTGSTFINSLSGIGVFGNILSTLTTPPFYVVDGSGFATVSSPSASRVLASTPLVSLAVPQGPKAHSVKKR